MMRQKTLNKNGNIIGKLLVSASFGLAISEIANAIAFLISGILTNRFLGNIAMSATGMAGVSYTILSVFSAIISGGGQKICSEEIGSGKIENARKTFSMVIFVTLIFSLLIGIAGIVFSSPLANAVGAKSSDVLLFTETKNYLIGIFIGAPANIFLTVLISFIQLEAKNGLITVSLIILTLTNIIFDLLNVLVFNLGTFGMGLATSLSFYCGVLVLLFYFFTKKALLKISFRKLDFHNLKKMTVIGLPRSTKRIANVIRPFFINRIILVSAATIGMSAYSVYTNFKYFPEAVPIGIGGAVFLLCGMFIGEKDPTSVKQLIRKSMFGIIVVVGSIAVIYFLLAVPIVRMYKKPDDEAFDMAVTVIRCHAVSLPFLAFNEFYASYVNGMGRNILSHVITFLERLIYIVLASFILSIFFGANGIWYAIAISEILLTVTILLVTFIRNIISPDKKEGLRMIKEEYKPSGNQFEVSIHNKEEIKTATSEIAKFCKDENIDEKHTYYIELFFEEIAEIIIERGFRERKNYNFDIRILKDGDDIILRTRDDTKAFSTVERMEISEKAKLNEDDKYIGIYMIKRIAKDFQYYNTLNMNNFIIKI